MLLSCAVAALAAGCGGSGAASTAPAATTSPKLDGIDSLLAEANRIERLLEGRVKRLVQTRSLAELSAELREAQAEVERAAARLDSLSVSSDLVEVRDGLASALRHLATALGQARGDVEDLDLGAALDELGRLDLSDAEAAVDQIRRLAGG